MAEKKSLVPVLTSNTGPGVTIDALYDKTNAWRAFDGSNTTDWGWLEGYYANVVYIKFNKPILLQEITVGVSSYGYTDINKIEINVDGKRQEFTASLTWTSPKIQTFTLTKPLSGKTVAITITNTVTKYKGVAEITLFGSSAELFLIEMNKKMYTIVDGNMTRISETDNYTADTFMKYGIDKDVIVKNMHLIKGTGDGFKLHTLS